MSIIKKVGEHKIKESVRDFYPCEVCGNPAVALVNDICEFEQHGQVIRLLSVSVPTHKFCLEHVRESLVVPPATEDTEAFNAFVNKYQSRFKTN